MQGDSEQTLWFCNNWKLLRLWFPLMLTF